MAIFNYFWLFLAIVSVFGYYMLFHFRLLATIIITFRYSKLFHLRLFGLCDAIIGYFWLLKVISPYVIIGNFRLL
jgi:hypothetical protein